MCVDVSYGLRLLELVVPPYKQQGENVNLICDYKLLGTDKLYSVQWYKDAKVFYRYLPQQSPQVAVYNVTGVNVNVSST